MICFYIDSLRRPIDMEAHHHVASYCDENASYCHGVDFTSNPMLFAVLPFPGKHCPRSAVRTSKAFTTKIN